MTKNQNSRMSYYNSVFLRMNSFEVSYILKNFPSYFGWSTKIWVVRGYPISFKFSNLLRLILSVYNFIPKIYRGPQIGVALWAC